MTDAVQFLNEAAQTMIERGKTYDSEEITGIGGEDKKERSMGKTIVAFNAITKHELTESEGWLLMTLLKQVRQFSQEEFHEDSALDGVAYTALLAESLSNE